MTDCLSNSSWISPQIDCLLFLQNIRINCSDLIDKFFLSVTTLGELMLPTILAAIAYWCIDFKIGIYLFSLQGINLLITQFLKMIACVYRPWVLDSKIEPSKLAIAQAGGYSFPSGHSATSSSVIGGIAYTLRKNKVLCLFLICLILLVGFSRLWLGVHTPQDVICGLSVGLILVFAINGLINWAEKDKNRYLYLLFAIDIFAVLALIYVFFFNTYRIDYLDGKLLVDPMKSKQVLSTCYGYALGLLNGCFLCRRFFPFEPKEFSKKKRIIIGIIGAILIIFLLKSISTLVTMFALGYKMKMLLMFLAGFFVTLIYPLIFTKLKKSDL